LFRTKKDTGATIPQMATVGVKRPRGDDSDDKKEKKKLKAAHPDPSLSVFEIPELAANVINYILKHPETIARLSMVSKQ
jgi:hypothetical protein